MLSRMLVPTNFSRSGQLAAHYAFDLARSVGGRVILLHVLEDEAQAHGLQTARARLAQLGRASRRPPQTLVRSAQPGVAAVIVQVAEETGADVIIMGVCAVAGSASPELSATILEVIRSARVPVQIVPRTLRLVSSGDRWRTVTGL